MIGYEILMVILLLIGAVFYLNHMLNRNNEDEQFRLWMIEVEYRMNSCYPTDGDALKFFKECFEEGCSPEEAVQDYKEEKKG